MNFEEAGISGQSFIELSGRFTFTDYERFRPLLDAIKAASRTRHVLDLGKVDFIDSAALGMLLLAHEEARSRGSMLVLRRPQGQVWRTLQTAMLDTIFTIER